MSLLKKLFHQPKEDFNPKSERNPFKSDLVIQSNTKVETILDLYFESKLDDVKNKEQHKKTLSQKSKSEVLEDYYDALDFFHEKTKHLDHLRIRMNQVMKFDETDKDAYAKSLSEAFKEVQ